MRPSTSLASSLASAAASGSSVPAAATARAAASASKAPKLLRGSLSSKPGPGGPAGSFVLPCRKLIVEYCPEGPSSQGTRGFLTGKSRRIVELAREFPSVEMVVKERPHKQPIVRGFYMNGRTKEIPLQNLAPSSVEKKVELILNASGKKIVHLRRRPVESITESARGIWSALHAPKRSL